MLILPGAQIGQPGFGFASTPAAISRFRSSAASIIQDRVEIGAGTTIDRGALGDTVIGEGTKLDNLVQIGHNAHLGRHCVIVAQVGVAGSCEFGDFVVLGGQVGHRRSRPDRRRRPDGGARSASQPGADR